MTHYLYIIGPINQDSPIVKIGITHDVNKRLKGLQASGPVPLELKAVWQFEDRLSAYKTEQLAHHVFRRKNAHYEWFNVTLKKVEEFMGRPLYLDRSRYGAIWEGLPAGIRVTGEMKKEKPLFQKEPARRISTAPANYVGGEADLVKKDIIGDMLRHRRARLVA